MPINLGQITFGIGADTTRLRSSITDITRFGAAVNAVAANANTAGTAVESAFRRQEAAVINALQKVQRFQDAVANLKAPPAALQNGLNQLSTRALDQMVQRMTSGQMTALQFQREMERFNQTMSNSHRIMNQWTAAQKSANATGLATNLQKLSSTAVLVAGPLSGIATRISVLSGLADHFSGRWAAMIAGVAAGAYTFFAFSKAAIEVGKSLEQIQQTLTAVHNSSTIANLNMKYLAELSMRTGIAFGDLAKQYSQVLAAAKGTNLEGERTNKIFEIIAYSGAKLGLANEEITGSFRAIQQMMSKGVVQAEELKGQLGDRLPGALQAFAAGMGITTLKLAEMMKQGSVSTSNLVKFVEELKKRYNIDTSAKIDTITAAEGRLQTARMLAVDSLDKVVGISSAYKNVLNTISEAITNSASSSRQFVEQILRVGIALTAAFAGPALIAAIGSLNAGVIALTRGIMALNVATAAGAFTSFAKLLTGAAIAVAAYYGSEEILAKAMGETGKSALQATPAVEEYIKAQKTLVTSVRGPTQDYIKQQQELLKTQEAQRADLVKQAEAITSWGETMEKAGMSAASMDRQFEAMSGATVLKNLSAANEKIEQTKKNIAELTDILKRQTAEETKARPDPVKDLTTRQTGAIAKAKESIRDLKASYDALFMSPAAKEYAETQNEINHRIEQFKQGLENAEIPATKVKELVKDYSEAIRKLKEGELTLKNHVSAFTTLGEIFGRSMNTGVSQFVDNLVEGKKELLNLKDIAKTVAKDILNTWIKLAYANPLKNMLFGTSDTVMGGSGGIGGILGNLGSLFGAGNSAQSTSMATLSGNTGGAFYGPGFANGGIMTSKGRMPLNKYSRGGVANSPQLAMFGEGRKPEAYVPLPDGRSIPVKMTGNGGSGSSGMNVQIHNYNGSKVDTKKTTAADGSSQLEVMITAVENHLAGKMKAGRGALYATTRARFGLETAKGNST